MNKKPYFDYSYDVFSNFELRKKIKQNLPGNNWTLQGAAVRRADNKQ